MCPYLYACLLKKNPPFHNLFYAGPSLQTDVAISAPRIEETIIFPGRGTVDVPVNSIPISFTLTDDEIALEAIEMYIARLEIVTGTGVMLSTPEATINIVDDDGESDLVIV